MSELRALYGGSAKTLYNKVKFASQLGLIDWIPNSESVALSELGKDYIDRRDPRLPLRLSERQIGLLRDLVAKNPLKSAVLSGIASVVEATYKLAANSYPVNLEKLIQFFPDFVGKNLEWQTAKARYNATRMYANYATDLGLLAKSESALYITPMGYRFVTQLQLHKGIAMISIMGVE